MTEAGAQVTSERNSRTRWRRGSFERTSNNDACCVCVTNTDHFSYSKSHSVAITSPPGHARRLAGAGSGSQARRHHASLIFVHLLTNLSTRCFKNEQIDFDANRRKWSTGRKSIKTVNFGGQEGKGQGHTRPKINLEAWRSIILDLESDGTSD